jgi:hypothetical protein
MVPSDIRIARSPALAEVGFSARTTVASTNGVRSPRNRSARANKSVLIPALRAAPMVMVLV